MPIVSIPQSVLFKKLGRTFGKKYSVKSKLADEEEFDALCFSFGLELDEITQNVRPFVVAAILRDIRLDESSFASLIDLQEKLHQNICRKRSLVAIGTHDLDTLKPPFYYDAQHPKEIRFVPLNKDKEYSADELMTLYTTDQHLKPYLALIQDKPKYPVIRDSTGTILSMPPIINGQHSRISSQSRNIFIEATATDLQKAIVVLDILVTMFSEYCQEPFHVEPVEVIQFDGTRHIYPRLEYRDEVVSVGYVNRVLGTQFSQSEVTEMLGQMGLVATSIENQSGSVDASGLISVRIPPTRHDILHACDIAEDVAIVYGYDRIPEQLPETYCISQSQPINRLSDLMRAEIAQAGFTEALSFSLCSKDDLGKNLRQDINSLPVVHIMNPKTVDFQVVRTTLLPGILHTISNNRSLPLPLKIFEVQDVVLKDSTKDVGARNERRICAVYYNKSSGFEVIHGLLDRIMQLLQVEPACTKPATDSASSGDQRVAAKRFYKLEITNDPTFFPGRCANILIKPDNLIIGHIGVLHPEVLRNFDLSMPCSALEMNLEVFL